MRHFRSGRLYLPPQTYHPLAPYWSKLPKEEALQEMRDKQSEAIIELTSFHNREILAECLQYTLEHHAGTIAKWLLDERGRKLISLFSHWPTSCGYGLHPVTGAYFETSLFQVILIRCEHQEE